MPSTSRRRRAGGHDFVVVANRLPVDLISGPGEEPRWTRSPGGLVTALEPVMRQHGGAWIGWNGAAGDRPGPVRRRRHAPGAGAAVDGGGRPTTTRASPTPRCGRCTTTSSRRPSTTASGGTPTSPSTTGSPRPPPARPRRAPRSGCTTTSCSWCRPMLRRRRPDLRIGFFNHIPFPPYEIFAQLPWRKQVLEGLLGADLLGFQREQDAGNLAACRPPCRPARLGAQPDHDRRRRRCRRPHRHRPRRTRSRSTPPGWTSWPAARRSGSGPSRSATSSGRPENVLLGVDRLDYTKGIMHRLKAFGELLDDGRLDPADTVLVMVATPSRERVEQYRRLKDEIELAVGRINGKHGSLGRLPVVYLHHSYPRAGDGGDVPGRRRHARHLAARRHEPGGQGVRGVPARQRRGARPQRVHRRRRRARPVPPGEPARHRGAQGRHHAGRGHGSEGAGATDALLRRRVLENDVNAWARRFLAELEDPS